jgi:hypothetical protein
MSWEAAFVERLSELRFEDVFNPYADRCDVFDLEDAPAIRRRNLVAVLRARHNQQIESIWFGRDLGYRGGRRTGLALTDEVTMLDATRDGEAAIHRATTGAAVAERTAAVIWSVIRRLAHPPLLWNAFPLHPHLHAKPFTNRAHSIRERQKTAWAIQSLIERFGHPRLIAVCRDASQALQSLGFEHELVRHPSYGGQREFIATMERIHSLVRSDDRLV